MRGLIAAAVLILLSPSPANADEIDLARSSVKVNVRQMNVPFSGQFRRFSADLAWDDKNPEASRAVIDVDLNSFDLGDASFNDEAKGKAFLNVAAFPHATFTSSAIRSLGGGRYEAAGKLSIKGIARDVTAAFTIKDDGGRRVFDAAFPLKRLDYRIGEGEWQDTKVLADETQVQVRLVTAARARQADNK
jgi:polyisoprenoid-binding protein YceI